MEYDLRKTKGSKRIIFFIYKMERKQYNKEYYRKDKDRLLQYCKDYVKKNMEKTKKYQKQWRLKNKDTIRKYMIKNREKINGCVRISRQKQRDTIPEYRLRQNLKSRIWIALKSANNSKHENTMKYVGCSLDELKKYLEKQFIKNMSWNNYGSVWHLDHCVPCNNFDLSKDIEVKKCFNYNNMKPMFAKENLSKQNFYSEPTLTFLFSNEIYGGE